VPARWLPGLSLSLLIWMIVGVNCPALAGPSYADLKWSHADPANLLKFKLLLASEAGQVETAEEIDVGLPLREGGVYRWSLLIPENEFVWVAVIAVDRRGAESPPSAWRRLDWDRTQVELERPGAPFLVRPARP